MIKRVIEREPDAHQKLAKKHRVARGEVKVAGLSNTRAKQADHAKREQEGESSVCQASCEVDTGTFSVW